MSTVIYYTTDNDPVEVEELNLPALDKKPISEVIAAAIATINEAETIFDSEQCIDLDSGLLVSKNIDWDNIVGLLKQLVEESGAEIDWCVDNADSVIAALETVSKEFHQGAVFNWRADFNYAF